MGLISSLFNVTDVPFCQPQQLHSKHYGATFVFQFFLLTMQDVNLQLYNVASHQLCRPFFWIHCREVSYPVIHL